MSVGVKGDREKVSVWGTFRAYAYRSLTYYNVRIQATQLTYIRRTYYVCTVGYGITLADPRLHFVLR